MRTSGWIGLIIIIIIIGGAVWYFSSGAGNGGAATTTPPTSTTTEMTEQTTTTPQGITFMVPAAFALATGNEPITVSSYIPPCDQGYDYCIYKNDQEFAGTNFESAGVSMTAKPALTTQAECLDTPPSGYASGVAPSSTATGTGYATSLFANLGNGAAGHEAVDSYYRLYQTSNSECTEFDLRVAQTDYGNYPAGQIQEFTTADQTQATAELQGILSDMTLGGAAISWPSAS